MLQRISGSAMSVLQQPGGRGPAAATAGFHPLRTFGAYLKDFATNLGAENKPLSRCVIPLQNRGHEIRLRPSLDRRPERGRPGAPAPGREGCEKVFREVASGAKTDRRQLRRALDQLAAGDVLIVTRLDRLARSTRDLLNTLATVTDRKAGFRSLGDTWADSTTPHGRLMLTVLGGLAEFERELIRARTSEGQARAKASGVKLGRKPKLTPHQRREALKRRDAGEP